MMQSQESSSSYYQEQIRQPSDEELFLTLKEEIKKEKYALEMRLPNMETKMDAKMIASMDTNLKILNREMCARKSYKGTIFEATPKRHK